MMEGRGALKTVLCFGDSNTFGYDPIGVAAGERRHQGVAEAGAHRDLGGAYLLAAGVGDGRDGAARVVQRVARQGLEVKEADDGFLGPEQLGLKRHFHSNRLIKMKCPMPK